MSRRTRLVRRRRRKHASDERLDSPAPAACRGTQRWPGKWLGPALLILPFAEVGVTVALTRWLGATVAYALYAVPAVFGLLIQWRRYLLVKETWQEMEIEVREKRKESFSDPAWLRKSWGIQVFWLTVLLLLVPGVLSHLAAFYLLIRPPACWLAVPNKRQE